MAFDYSRPISSLAEEQDKQQPQQPPEFDWSSAKIETPDRRGLGRKIYDWGLEAASGAAGATQAITDAFGANNDVSSTLGEISKLAQQELSKERKAEKFLQAKRMEAAEQSGDWWREAGAAIQNFAESPMAATASGMGSILPTAAVAAIPVVGQGAALGLGAVQGAGAVKQSIYERVEQDALEKGYSAEEAARMAQAAQSYGGDNTDQILLGTAMGLAAGGSGVERFIGGKGVAGGVLSRIARGMAEESVPEMLQGGQERLAANIAAQRAGFGGETWTGVVGQGVTEGLASLGMGGATGAARPQKNADKPALDPNKGFLSRAAIEAQQQSGQSPLGLPAPGQTSGEAYMPMSEDVPGASRTLSSGRRRCSASSCPRSSSAATSSRHAPHHNHSRTCAPPRRIRRCGG